MLNGWVLKMKNFVRKILSFSLCGLNCALCPMRIDGYCPGCGGGTGNQSCTIAKCSLQHGGVAYCFLCTEYPCGRYENIGEYDSFITHQRQLSDLARAQEIGMDAYNEEQSQKAEILQKLLSDYNDGRRKTFYFVAINLLSLQAIKDAMQKADKHVSLQALTIKDKADYVASLFQDIAVRQGLVLKLRKKPAKE